MTRRHFSFDCLGNRLAATLDGDAGRVGLLIVTGGNEVRCGAFGGQAVLANAVAENGFPAMRFDRRGIGDSEGLNGGFRSADPDTTLALEAMRREFPALERIVAFGNCDAATALVLREGAGCDGLVLANPWTFDEGEIFKAILPPSAIRSRYAEKLRNPREWLRLFKGEVNLGALAKGLKGASKINVEPSSLADEIKANLARYAGDTRILLAGRDRTAQAFAANWPGNDQRVSTLPDADHAFSGAAAQQWLLDAVLAALHEQARQLDMG